MCVLVLADPVQQAAAAAAARAPSARAATFVLGERAHLRVARHPRDALAHLRAPCRRVRADEARAALVLVLTHPLHRLEPVLQLLVGLDLAAGDELVERLRVEQVGRVQQLDDVLDRPQFAAHAGAFSGEPRTQLGELVERRLQWRIEGVLVLLVVLVGCTLRVVIFAAARHARAPQRSREPRREPADGGDGSGGEAREALRE